MGVAGGGTGFLFVGEDGTVACGGADGEGEVKSALGDCVAWIATPAIGEPEVRIRSITPARSAVASSEITIASTRSEVNRVRAGCWLPGIMGH